MPRAPQIPRFSLPPEADPGPRPAASRATLANLLARARTNWRAQPALLRLFCLVAVAFVAALAVVIDLLPYRPVWISTNSIPVGLYVIHADRQTPPRGALVAFAYIPPRLGRRPPVRPRGPDLWKVDARGRWRCNTDIPTCTQTDGHSHRRTDRHTYRRTFGQSDCQHDSR